MNLFSCDKNDVEKESANFITIRGDNYDIETIRIRMTDGITSGYYKTFYLEFYNEEVEFFKNIYGYDSIAYSDNCYRLSYELHYPKDSSHIEGQYIYYNKPPYPNDFTYTIGNIVYFESRENGMDLVMVLKMVL
jgi:hypothetical protein